MKIKLLSAVSVAFIALAASAQAANVYQLNFTAGTDSGLVDFTTSGPWTAIGTAITGVSGQIDGSAITGLSSYAGADNLLDATAPHVDFGGVSVSTVLDTFNIADYLGGAVLTKASVNPYGYPQDLSSVNGAIVALPEPATWAMLILGVGMVGFATRRRRGAVALSA